MPITPIPCTTIDDCVSRITGDAPILLYKHSFACGLSSMAKDEVEAFAAEHPEVPIWLVDVLGQRPLSQALAARLGVEHESPQAIVVRDGRALWDASHRRVTRAALAEAWRGAVAPADQQRAG
jgi:bacillithiol system protein YtxJ